MRILDKFTVLESFSKFRLTSFGVQCTAFALIQERLGLKFFSYDGLRLIPLLEINSILSRRWNFCLIKKFAFSALLE